MGLAGQLCSAGDDGQALVWDLAAVPRGTRPVAVQVCLLFTPGVMEWLKPPLLGFDPPPTFLLF